MSKAGNFTAYQQYRPLPDTVTPAINNWASFLMQKEEQQARQQERDRNWAEKEQAKKQANLDKYIIDLDPKDSGVQEINDLHGVYIQEVNKQLEGLIPILDKNDPTDPEWRKAKRKADKFLKYPEMIKAMTDAIAAPHKDYLEGRDSKYVIDADIDNNFKDFKNFKPIIDENGDPAVKVGNETFTYADIINGKTPIKATPKFDMDKHAQELAKNLTKSLDEKITYDPNDPFRQITSTAVNQDELKAITKLTDINGNPTQYGASYLKQLGINPNSEEAKTKLAELETALNEKTLAYLPEKYKEDIDFTAKNQAATLAQRERQNREENAIKRESNAIRRQIAQGKGEIKKPVEITSFIPLPKEESEAEEKGLRGFSIADNSISVTPSENITETVKSLWIDPKSKRIKVKVIKVNDKGTTGATEEEVVYDTANKQGSDVQRFTAEILKKGRGLNLNQTHTELKKMIEKENELAPATTPTPKKKNKKNASEYGL
jgi:hypothetical protein